MPATKEFGAKFNRTGDSLKLTRKKSKNRRKKRKFSSNSMEEIEKCPKRPKRPRKQCVSNRLYRSLCENLSNDQDSNGGLTLEEEEVGRSREKSMAARFRRETTRTGPNTDGPSSEAQQNPIHRSSSEKCWIASLPQEILLKIFSYLPLGMLLHTVPQVCQKWETLALDWTLWKAVENLTIKNMVISTTKLRTLLRTIPKLKKLELILRNDTEELLHELIKTHKNLEVLKLDRCYRSTLQMNILSQTVTSILEFCPKLKTVMLTDTYFHSKTFYKCLAKKFRNIERINVTCTTKSEMDVFMENLRENVPEVEFQRVPMMGRAEGKQIYWGPILGLVVRPIPTSPFHRQYTHDNYPTYAF